MLKKINLDKTKQFEIAVATEIIAGMVTGFAAGHEHILAVGSEQGDIAGWDDLICQHANGDLEHFQVKRNLKDFSDQPSLRGTKTRGTDVGAPQELSPLDESMKDMGMWTAINDPSSASPRRRFRLIVPDMSTQIKKDISTADLYNFSRSLTNSTTAASLALSPDSVTHRIFNWLTTWCEFRDWGHILSSLRCLRVQNVGTEADIEDRTEQDLKRCFNNMKEVRKKIHGYIAENSSFTSSMTARPLLAELRSELKPEVSLWTQYRSNGVSWHISGTTDPDHSQIERPNIVARASWEPAHPFVLKIDCSSTHDEPIPTAIRRLVMHLQLPLIAHIKECERWKERTIGMIGGTLGTSDEDCEAISAIDYQPPNLAADIRSLDSGAILDDEATALHNEMDNVTWEMLKKKIRAKILSLPTSELRNQIEKRWNNWEQRLNSSVHTHINLLRSMLHPNAEGNEINAIVRVGPKTLKMLADGFIMQLAISVALSDTDQGWDAVEAGTTVSTKALRFWSGPSGSKRRVRALSDEGIRDLIGKEPANVLVLSGISESPVDLLQATLADTSVPSFNLATGRQPTLVVTNSMTIRRFLNNADLAGLRSNLLSSLDSVRKSQENEINSIMS